MSSAGSTFCMYAAGILLRTKQNKNKDKDNTETLPVDIQMYPLWEAALFLPTNSVIPILLQQLINSLHFPFTSWCISHFFSVYTADCLNKNINKSQKDLQTFFFFGLIYWNTLLTNFKCFYILYLRKYNFIASLDSIVGHYSLSSYCCLSIFVH